MKTKNLLFFALIPAVIFSSCTIEKRLYTGGYHVEFKKSAKVENNASATLAEKKSNQASKQDVVEQELLTVSELAVENTSIQNGNTVEPRFAAKSDNVRVNTLENPTVNDLSSDESLINSSVESKKATKKPAAPKMEEMTILILLWFFLGFVAAHRWYAKKPAGWNILFILTAGGCGVWAIIDLVHIITGDF